MKGELRPAPQQHPSELAKPIPAGYDKYYFADTDFVRKLNLPECPVEPGYWSSTDIGGWELYAQGPALLKLMNRFPMNVFSKPYHHPWSSNTCLRYGYTYSKEISKDEILEKAGFQNYLDLQLPDYTSLY